MKEASVGRIVLVRTQKTFNGQNIHPAIITRVWQADRVNVKVLPDCGDPYDETSIELYDTRALAEATVPTPGRVAFWPEIR